MVAKCGKTGLLTACWRECPGYNILKRHNNLRCSLANFVKALKCCNHFDPANPLLEIILWKYLRIMYIKIYS